MGIDGITQRLRLLRLPLHRRWLLQFAHHVDGLMLRDGNWCRFGCTSVRVYLLTRLTWAFQVDTSSGQRGRRHSFIGKSATLLKSFVEHTPVGTSGAAQSSDVASLAAQSGGVTAEVTQHDGWIPLVGDG